MFMNSSISIRKLIYVGAYIYVKQILLDTYKLFLKKHFQLKYTLFAHNPLLIQFVFENTFAIKTRPGDLVIPDPF